MKFITKRGDFEIYELDKDECRKHQRVYPTFVCWSDEDNACDMYCSENETETLEEMLNWCDEYSY